MTFPTIYLHVVKVKPFKKNFGKFSISFITKSFCSVSTTIRCGIISVTGCCDSFEEVNKLHKKILKISRPRIDLCGIP